MTRVLLGCGSEHREGWLHHDRVRHSQHVDVAFDLEGRPWPLGTESVEEVVALDVLEHLVDTVAFFDECWRLLVVGGTVEVRVPHWRSENAWRDPTHKRAFHLDTFDYFDPETPWGASYGRFYTKRYWELLYVEQEGGNVTAKLRKRARWPN